MESDSDRLDGIRARHQALVDTRITFTRAEVDREWLIGQLDQARADLARVTQQAEADGRACQALNSAQRARLGEALAALRNIHTLVNEPFPAWTEQVIRDKCAALLSPDHARHALQRREREQAVMEALDAWQSALCRRIRQYASNSPEGRVLTAYTEYCAAVAALAGGEAGE